MPYHTMILTSAVKTTQERNSSPHENPCLIAKVSIFCHSPLSDVPCSSQIQKMPLTCTMGSSHSGILSDDAHTPVSVSEMIWKPYQGLVFHMRYQLLPQMIRTQVNGLTKSHSIEYKNLRNRQQRLQQKVAKPRPEDSFDFSLAIQQITLPLDRATFLAQARPANAGRLWPSDPSPKSHEGKKHSKGSPLSSPLTCTDQRLILQDLLAPNQRCTMVPLPTLLTKQSNSCVVSSFNSPFNSSSFGGSLPCLNHSIESQRRNPCVYKLGFVPMCADQFPPCNQQYIFCCPF